MQKQGGIDLWVHTYKSDILLMFSVLLLQIDAQQADYLAIVYEAGLHLTEFTIQTAEV